MNYRSFSDQELLEKTCRTVLEERRLTLEVIELLKEVASRRLHAQRGFPSLFEYCTKELGYSESEAYRRISAMRLTQEIPEVTQKLETGSLNLTNLAQAVSYFRSEEKHQKLSTQDKREVLKSLENKSTREAERELKKRLPEAVLPTEKTRVLSETHMEVKIVLDQDTLRRLDQLKALLSHKNPSMNYTELIKELAAIALKKLNPGQKISSASTKDSPASEARDKSHTRAEVGLQCRASSAPKVNSRYIPQSLKREIWNQNKGECGFVDPLSKRKCNSTHLLEIDHLQPMALGGKTEPENLRLMCRAHNQLAAIQKLGQRKMEKYIRKL